jgi:hypothetical protein
MSVLNTISGASSAVNVGGSALSLVGMGKSLISKKDTKPGIEGLLFDVPMNDSVTRGCQITDHWVESNSAIQDHIALEPIKITLTGKVGELVYKTYAAIAFAQAVIDRLGPLGIFTPSQSVQLQKAIATAERATAAYFAADKALNTLSDVFKNQPTKNAQQAFFNELDQWVENRALLSVETPWKTYQNMAIESFTADQDDTNMLETLFTINFKQIKYVETATYAGKLSGRAEQQASDIKNTGNTKGDSMDSILSGAASNVADIFKSFFGFFK